LTEPSTEQQWHAFISYAHSSTARPAEDLHQVLERAGLRTFLDKHDESTGEGIPEQVFDSLLASRVVVIFADANYFTRRYCAEELSTALAAYRALARRHAGRDELDEAVRPVVVALPAKGEPLPDLELFPPEVRSKNWPTAGETHGLADLVRVRVERLQRTIGERLQHLGELVELRERLRETMVIPVPKQLSGVPVYHEAGMPPSIGDGFVGRARELWELHEALVVRQGGAAALTAALEGGGGFGKTRLALEYVHRYGPLDYRGGIFWVNAEVPEDRLDAQLHAILKLLDPSLPELAAFRESGRQVTAELGAALQEVATDRRILYIVDNVPEPQGEHAPEPLHRWCPAAGQVSLLLTSRSRTLVGGLRRVAVKELSSQAAVRLLLRGYENRRALPDESWRQVVTWVGEWPLALEVLNASLQAGAVSPGELLTAASGGGPMRELERQMAALRSAVATGALRGVAEALGMSYWRLTDGGRRAARQLALLAPNPIPVRLVAQLDPRVRVQLRVRSFVSEERSGEVEMYGRMHRVLADFLRGEIEDRMAETRDVCGVLLEAMTWEAAADPASWPLLDACRPHVEAVVDRPADPPPSAEVVERMVQLCRVACRLLRKQGQPAMAAERAQRCVDLARRSLGPDHPATMTATGNLAWALWELGQVARARRLQERVLEARRRQLGEEHPDTLWAMGGLATILRDDGELGRARELQEQLLAWRMRLFHEDHPDSLTAMGSLASTLREQGELDRARELQERVLEAKRRMVGEEHPDSLSAMGDLGQTLRDQGQLEEARALHEQVLESRMRLFGGDHPDSLLAMSELAETLRTLGALSRAVQLQRGVVDARRRLLGERHPATLSAAGDLEGLEGRPPRP
jgi:tetratricopeptide (TPR) repeat protein